MPIGFDPGDIAAERSDSAGVRPEAFSETVRAGQPLIGSVWTRWKTAEDERVCPECGPLDGKAWPASDGPEPPLHNHCRCIREVAFIEFASRVDG
jgi:F like protein